MMGGNGTLSGGEGTDTFEFTYSATKALSAVIEDFVPTEDKIVVNFDGNTELQLTSVKSGDDVVWRDGGGKFNVTLKGVRDNDYFDGDTPEQVWDVLRLTNSVRGASGLPLLTLSEGLMTGASIRAKEIVESLSYTRPDGTPYYTVLDGKYNYHSENLDGGASSPVVVLQD